MIRPFGSPPMPSAMSSDSEPVEVDEISATGLSAPSRMIEPLPNCRSICASAEASAFSLSHERLSFNTRISATASSLLVPLPADGVHPRLVLLMFASYGHKCRTFQPLFAQGRKLRHFVEF